MALLNTMDYVAGRMEARGGGCVICASRIMATADIVLFRERAFVEDNIKQDYLQSVTLTITDIDTNKVTYRLLAMALRDIGQFLISNDMNVLDFWITRVGGNNPDFSNVMEGYIRKYQPMVH